jgi:hypothetical protein
VHLRHFDAAIDGSVISDSQKTKAEQFLAIAAFSVNMNVSRGDDEGEPK